jgi:general secretion pathway protein F
MFEDQGAELPWSTRFLMWCSHAVVDWWWLLILFGGLAVWGARRFRASEGGRLWTDTVLLRLPLVGELARKIAVARFARTLSTMLASGVQLLEALDIVRGLLQNVVLERVVSEARDNIREGESVASALKRSGQFPPLVTHMIAVGERSGQLEQMLTDVANAYDREASTAIGRATAVLEPVMIVLMAGVVGFIVFSIMTPILQMNQMVGK